MAQKLKRAKPKSDDKNRNNCILLISSDSDILFVKDSKYPE